MKTTLQLLAILAALLLLPVSCQDLFRQVRTGTLIISLRDLPPAGTRAGDGPPDSGTFLLSVTDAAGNPIYTGPYAQSPDILQVPAGSYTVSAVSGPFDTPDFDTPQWGDTQIVTVAAGSTMSVELECSQLNSGLRIHIDPSFRQAFPAGKLYLRSAEGELYYASDETRTAYFRPGTVTLTLDDGGFVQTLSTRTLEARQILTVSLSANVGAKSGGISLQVDTSRIWLTDRLVIGGQEGADDAYDVLTARSHAGENDAWVCGYIVGIATSTGKISFDPPFTKDTNLILGTKAATRDKDFCLSVELRSGAVRSALNLQDNPGLLGKKVYIKGDLVAAYYGIPGLKAPTEYRIN